MSQGATQRQGRTALYYGSIGTGILALCQLSGSLIGFPDAFLVWSSSVVQGIAIASTLIFIAASGFLVTTHPQPVRTASVVGGVAMLGGVIAACCSLIAPGILLAVTAGITYAAAWTFVSATFSKFSAQLAQPSDRKSSLASNPIIWLLLGLSGFVWLAIILFTSYGLIAAFWLFLAPYTLFCVWISFTLVTQSFRQAFKFYKLEPALCSIYLVTIVMIVSGNTLNHQGAIVWIVEVIILTFSILTALLLHLFVTPFSDPDIHLHRVEIQSLFPNKPFRSLILSFPIVIGLWGYSDHFWGGVTLTERLSSLGSATHLDKILATHHWSEKITISSDERFLANGGDGSRHSEETVQVWDLKTGKLTRTFSGYSNPLIMDSPSSQPVLLMRNSSGRVEKWNLINDQHQLGNEQDEKLTPQQPKPPQIQPPQTPLPRFLPRDSVLLASSTDGKTIATGFDKKPMRDRLLIWDTSTEKLLYSLSPRNYGGAIALSPSGHLLANDPSGNIHVWRLPRP